MFKLSTIKPAPLQFFPSISWFMTYALPFKKIHISEQINQKNYGNRLIIPGPNKLQQVSIPLTKKSLNSSIHHIEMSNQHKWKKELKHALKTTYGKSAYFDHYENQIHALLSNNERYAELCIQSIRWGLKSLQWDIPVVFCSDYNIQTNNIITETPPYFQVFQESLGFIPDMPIVDIIFNLGPEAGVLIERFAEKNT